MSGPGASHATSAVGGRWSRLLIDLNRPRHAPDSIPLQSEIYQVPGNQHLDEATREYRRQHLFTPFHQRLQRIIDRRLAAGREAGWWRHLNLALWPTLALLVA